MKKVVFIIIVFIMFSCKKHNTSLVVPSLFSNNMVMQRESSFDLWGYATEGTKIKIKTSWGYRTDCFANNTNKWVAKINTPKAGGPHYIIIKAGANVIKLNNILSGDIWLASGQSNMEMPLRGWPPSDTILNSENEIKNADYPEIRMFTVKRNVSAYPSDECEGEWKVCTPDDAGDFSATAYFFARKLYNELKIPIGIIHSSWGGTPVESWIDPEYLKKDEDFNNIIEKIQNNVNAYKNYENWIEKHKVIEVKASKENEDAIESMVFYDDVLAMEEIDDENWKEMELPGLWEKEPLLGQFDGVVWFRKEFEINDDIDSDSLILNLGPIDDRDVTYFNGKIVGKHMKSGEWKIERIYKIPKDYVKRGKNVIAIRVIDTQGGGGIYGTKENLCLGYKKDNRDKKISLAGVWKYLPVALYRKNKFYLFSLSEYDFWQRPIPEVEIGPYTASVLFNGMIYPLKGLSLKGCIWYQGESNVGRDKQYLRIFPILINSWRKFFKNDSLPFYYVQIAPYKYDGYDLVQSAGIRDVQRRILSIVPNTGMAVTLDIGNVENIHPANKKDVGERLALWALAKVYNKNDVCYSGPLFKNYEINGNKIKISFTNICGGLIFKPFDGQTMFEIAADNGKYYPANVKIEGDCVVVWSDKVNKPANVRYAFRNASIATLFNNQMLPSSTFTTEELK